MLVDALVILVIALVCLFWLTAARLDYATYALQQADEELEETALELAQTITGATDLIVLVAPLLEQTDWMTGRWNGQLSTLQNLEKQRDANIVAARSAMNSIPFIKEATKEAVPEFATVIAAHEEHNA